VLLRATLGKRFSGGATSQRNPGTLPTPPANATVFTSLESASGWQSCNSSDCAGGSGSGTYWMAQNQSTPSLDGNSVQLYNSGTGGDALWWLKLGANDGVSNFFWDFYMQVDGNSLTAAQAIEFDIFQFISGYNYMMGCQCDYAASVWEVWDEGSSLWMHTDIPCQNFSLGVWHHIQMYLQRNSTAHTYSFVALAVDGTAYSLGNTYAAKNVGWGDDLGIQYQTDVNATGVGYNVWIDKSTLAVW
jgi:hypothetical protein